MLTCRQATDLVTAHLDDAMGTWQKIEYRLHLVVCPSCRVHLAKMRELIAALPHVRSDRDIPERFFRSLGK